MSEPTPDEAAEMNRRIRDEIQRTERAELLERSRSQEIAENRRRATQRIVDRLARREGGSE